MTTREKTPSGEDRVVVMVDADLRDLVPGYLAHRLQDIAKIEIALPRGDYEAIRSVGHGMKGSGGGYGFAEISEIGAALEDAARSNQQEDIRRQVEKLKAYLNRLEVIYPE